MAAMSKRRIIIFGASLFSSGSYKSGMNGASPSRGARRRRNKPAGKRVSVRPSMRESHVQTCFGDKRRSDAHRRIGLCRG
jgi:hypothetical protein